MSALTPASSLFARVVSEANAVRANSGSAFGEGDSFDGDGVGMNTSDEENYPYAQIRSRGCANVLQARESPSVVHAVCLCSACHGRQRERALMQPAVRGSKRLSMTPLSSFCRSYFFLS